MDFTQHCVADDRFVKTKQKNPAKLKVPVKKLNNGKGGGVSSCSGGDPVQPSLSYMDKVKVFVSLEI